MSEEDRRINHDCPYCPGELLEMESREHIKECSNGGDCPATFVAVIPGDSA